MLASCIIRSEMKVSPSVTSGAPRWLKHLKAPAHFNMPSADGKVQIWSLQAGDAEHTAQYRYCCSYSPISFDPLSVI